MEPQAGITLTFEVRTGTDTGAHFGPLGEIIGPAVVVTDEDADFSVDLPVPSELTPEGSVITCTVKQPGLSRTDPMLRNEWFYVLRGDLTAGSYRFGDVAILAAPDSVMPSGYVPVTGPGVAAGGTAGQVLTKASDTDFDTEWGDPQNGSVTAGKNVVVDNSVVSVPAIPASDVSLDTSAWVSSGRVPNLWDAQSALTEIEEGINGQVIPLLQNTVLPQLEDLGTAASLDAPAEGEDASDTEVVRGDDTRLAPGVRFTRDWRRDGLAGLASSSPVYISRSSVEATQPEHTLSIVGDSLRVSASAENTGGNVREIWPLSDDEFTDVEILARIDPPSEIRFATDHMTPQPGLALRVHDNGDGTTNLINVDVNIVYTYTPWYAGVWTATDNGDGTSEITQHTQQTVQMPSRQTWVLSRQRIDYSFLGAGWCDTFVVSDVSGFVAGDVVDVVSSGATFSRSGVTVLSVDPVKQTIVVNSPTGQTSAVAVTPDAGTVALTSGSYKDGIAVRRYYPQMLRVRIIGDQLMVKSWVGGVSAAPARPLSNRPQSNNSRIRQSVLLVGAFAEEKMARSLALRPGQMIG